eukprot:TRINITY_DN773045_c0_g1_i1.p1 TRINITY_DN773045_c0_g1~~TRINITY_DN773045_c0_g1_i1.p1  ORF type:complete len:214 (+),score=44.01 TRINITY_DN773045_c0_g1_i1:85-726(+)
MSKKLRWDGNTLIQPKRTELFQNSKFDLPEFQYNYRAEQLIDPEPISTYDDRSGALSPKSRMFSSSMVSKRTEELPIHESLAEKVLWSNSTQLTDKEKTEMSNIQAQEVMRNSQRTNSRLSNYISPEQAARKGLSTTRPKSRISLETLEESSLSQRRKPKKNLVKRFYHSGTYETSKLTGESMWSCCSQGADNAKGCCTKTTNLDAYNFASPF